MAQTGVNYQQQQDVEAQRQALYNRTPEEDRVLKRCNREAFYFRSLPFMSISAGCAMALASRGFLKPWAKFASLYPTAPVLPKPAVLGAAVGVGFFVGKLSYMSECASRIMRLENSPLGEALRKQQEKVGLTPPGPAEMESVQPSSNEGHIYTDHQPDSPPAVQPSWISSSPQQDVATPDWMSSGQRDATEKTSAKSYEEIRQRERAERRGSVQTTPRPTYTPPPLPAERQDDDTPSNLGARVRRNQYGDIIEE